MSDETPRAAWIETIDDGDVSGELAELYARERDPQTGKLDHILKVHSLLPASLDDHARLYHTAMHARGETSLGERELIGLVVSDLNGCRY